MQPKIDKIALRRHFRALRDQLPDRAEKSRLICKKLQNSPKIVDASTILLYFPIQSEVDIRPLFHHFSGQKRLALPKIITKSPADPQFLKHAPDPPQTARSGPEEDQTPSKSLHFHLFAPDTDLRPGPFGIPEPQNSLEITDYNDTVALVPGLSFDPQGYRLGYGGGFYDRFLCQHPEIYTIGLCYAACLTDQNFAEPHDIPLDQILTE